MYVRVVVRLTWSWSSSSYHGVSVASSSTSSVSCSTLPGQPVVCGDFKCPGQDAAIDGHLLDVSQSTSRSPRHQDILDLLIDIEGSDIVDCTECTHGRDHFLMLSDINARRRKPDVKRATRTRSEIYAQLIHEDFAANRLH